jgi:hypothetical protein
MLTVDIAAATMTIGIIAFLESTQAFFVAQRLVWAMIMIAIGMTMSESLEFGAKVPIRSTY